MYQVFLTHPVHLTSVISTISYPQSNGDIFIVIAPWGITNTRTNVVRVIIESLSSTSNTNTDTNVFTSVLILVPGILKR
jgi:hypothetical protein